MLAGDLIKQFVKKEEQGKVAVIGLLEGGNWWHIHRDEELPEDEDKEVAILITEMEWK